MADLEFNFEGGQEDQPLSSSDWIQINGSPIYTTDAMHGGFAGFFPQPSLVRRDRSLIGETHSGSIYFKVATMSGSPSSILLCQFSRENNALMGALRLHPQGRIDFQVTGTGIVTQTVGVYTIGKWHRVDWQFDTTQETIEIRFAENAESVVTENVTGDISGGTYSSSDFVRWSFGVGGGGGTREVTIDSIRLWNGLVWPEPIDPREPDPDPDPDPDPEYVSYDFEEGSNGALFVNPDFHQTSGSPVYTNDSMHGSLALMFPTGSFARRRFFHSEITHSGSLYFKPVQMANSPSSALLVQFSLATNANLCSIRMHPNGSVDITVTGLGVVASTTSRYEIGQWHRLDWRLDLSSGTLSVKFSSRAESSNGETISGLVSGGNHSLEDLDHWTFGVGGGSGAREVAIDSIRLWSDLLWPEPIEPIGFEPGIADYLWSLPTDHSAYLASRVRDVTDIRFAVSPTPSMQNPLILTAQPDGQGLVKADFDGLDPSRNYYYEVRDHSETGEAFVISGQGRFRTLPTPGSEASFTLIFGGCATTNNPQAASWDAIVDINPLLLIHDGDFHYRGPSSSDPSVHVTDNTNQILGAGQGALKEAMRQIPMVYLVDDHDARDGDNEDSDDPATAAANAAWRRYAPHPPLPNTDPGMNYFSMSIGRVRLINTWVRNPQRSPGLDPQSPNKSMFGWDQKQWLFDQLLNTPEPVKIINMGVAWVGPASISDGEDKMWSYDHERVEIANFINDNDINVLLIHSDTHSLQYIAPADNYWGGFPVYGSAPFANIGGGRYLQYSTDYYSTTQANQGAQFGILEFEDTGEAIAVDFTGYNALTSSVAIGAKTGNPLVHRHVFNLSKPTFAAYLGDVPISAAYLGDQQVALPQ